MADRLPMDPISIQMRQVRAAIKTSRKTGKPVKLDNRDKEQFSRAKDGSWRKKVKGGSRSLKVKAPRGKYLDDSGKWRDARKKHAYTAPPKEFEPIKVPKQKSARGDARAAERIAEILSRETPNSWDLNWLDPIVSRKSLSRKGGTVIGWRTRFELDSDTPYETTFHDMERALLAVANDSIVFKTFSKRNTMIRCIFRAPDEFEQWLTLSGAISFQVAANQAADQVMERSKRYTKFDKNSKPIVEQSHIIYRIRFVIQ